MKMKINDVLESYNKALEEYRWNRGLSTEGHFVSSTVIKKNGSMGPFRECDVEIIYVDISNNGCKNIAICGAVCKERCTVDQEEALINKTELTALAKLFLYLHEGVWGKIARGEYGTGERL